LATLRTDIPVLKSINDLQWKGPTPGFSGIAQRLDPEARGKLLINAQTLQASVTA
jgi:hypothetical protein